MDNDNKIGQPQQISIVSRFLGNNIAEIPESAVTGYDLEKEFAAMRKHRSFKIITILFGLIAVTTCTVFLLSREINSTSREVSIDIAEIEDLNLQNILDVVEKTKAENDRAIRILEALTTERDTQLATLESEYRQKSDSIAAMQGHQSRKNILQTEVDKAYEEAKATIITNFKSDITAAQTEVTRLKEQLTAFDSQRVKDAEKQQEVINNQKRLFDLEKRKLEQEYNSRINTLEQSLINQRISYERANTANIKAVQKSYQDRIDAIDPIFNDKIGESILERSSVLSMDLAELSFSSAPESIPNYAPITIESYESWKKYFFDIDYLTQKLKSIPFEREIPLYIAGIELLTHQVGNETATALQEYNDLIQLQQETITTQKTLLNEQHQTIDSQKKQLAEKDSLLATRNNLLDERSILMESLFNKASSRALTEYYTLIDEMMERNSIPAVILNSSNPQQILIRVNQQMRPKAGSIGYVYRNGRTAVGEITFFEDKKTVYAQINSSPATKPQESPFKLLDVILLTK